jgi:hypothetical protein
MSKIKNIYTFGTSFTKGGGFEFWSKYTKQKLNTAYSGLREDLNQHNFSWPGQLEKIINDTDINIINLAESGYGNERIYRKTYEIINSPSFNVDTDIFLFEFSHLGRREFYNTDIENIIIMNYSPIFDPEDKVEPYCEYNGHGYRYWEEDSDEYNKLKKTEPETQLLFNEYLEKYHNMETATNEMINNIILFLSYLTKKNIKFWFMQPPLGVDVSFFDKLKWNDRIINFDSKSNGFMLDFALFSFKGTGTITFETDGYVNDGHTGLIGNKLIAIKVFNHLIDKNIINGSIKKIDWENLEELQKKILTNVKLNKIKLL